MFYGLDRVFNETLYDAEELTDEDLVEKFDSSLEDAKDKPLTDPRSLYAHIKHYVYAYAMMKRTAENSFQKRIS